MGKSLYNAPLFFHIFAVGYITTAYLDMRFHNRPMPPSSRNSFTKPAHQNEIGSIENTGNTLGTYESFSKTQHQK